MANKFTLSANIENGLAKGVNYIVTPNVEKVLQEIVNAYQTGVHSFTVIGTYGTGKSSFLLNLEKDLDSATKHRALLKNPKVIHKGEIEVLNILGDAKSLSEILLTKLGDVVSVDDDDPLVLLKHYYNNLKKQGKMLFIAIDEFGKVLEHAAKYNPEEELYFFQKFTEFVNAPTRDIMLLTTLHQNFSAYAGKLSQAQKNEWNKVKGRFQEVVFAEPVEQLLYLAAEHISTERKWNVEDKNFRNIHQLAIERKFINSTFDFDTASCLYPLDAFAAYALTKAIQRYGQNERSLFSFLNTRGRHSVMEFEPKQNLTYNLAEAYDYIVNSFHSYLNDANADSMGWSSIRVAMERVEGNDWKAAQQMTDAIKIVKAIGMLNLFGNGGFSMTSKDVADYATMAMDVEYASTVLHELERLKIIRFAEYKKRIILFDGTDVNIEEEIANAGMIVPRPVNFVDELRLYFNDRVSSVKAYYYHRGTPRFFKYELRPEAEDIVPTGDIDGYVELIFSTSEKYYKELVDFSKKCEHAIIFAYFTNTDDIVEHLYNIQKYRYILDKVLIDKSDRVATKEVMQLMEYEKTLLNKSVSESLFNYVDGVVWLYKGQKCTIKSQRDFNKLLSQVCDDVYSLTPTLNNELFNKHKLSSSISAAKAKYLQALLDNGDKPDLGFEVGKFPPEKTIYYSLLKNTGLHIDGKFQKKPSNNDIMTLWDACEEFLRSTENRSRSLSELLKKLSNAPYKIKDGLLEFWIPTYLYIKRHEYSLYGEKDQYIPNFNMELLDLMKKHIGDFKVKAFAVSGPKLELYNQYRKFLNQGKEDSIEGTTFIQTIAPFLFFYKRMNEYTKNTRRNLSQETIRFRDTLAKAKDPEKTFFEDLPQALGYDINSDGRDYCQLLIDAKEELNKCYKNLIDRIEKHLIEGVGLHSKNYDEYVVEIRERLSLVKFHVLTGDKQQPFYQHIMAEFDNRKEWYQSVCYAVLGFPLERLRDDQEPMLLDEIVHLFRECEHQSVVSAGLDYRIDASEEKKSNDLESKIDSILSGDNNLDIYTLTRILEKRLKNGQD